MQRLGVVLHDNLNPAPRGASYESGGPALVIHDLTVNHPTVCSEAARWSTGQRGPAVSTDARADVDLSALWSVVALSLLAGIALIVRLSSTLPSRAVHVTAAAKV